MTTLLRRRLLLSAWILCLSVGIAAFVRLGPPVESSSLRTLLGSGPPVPSGAPSDPIDVVVSLARLAGLAILSYLLLLTVLQLLASRRGSRRIAGVARRVTPRFLMVLTAGVLVSSGTAFASAGPVPAAAAPGAVGSSSGNGTAMPTMEVIVDDAMPDSTQTSSAAAAGSVATAADAQVRTDGSLTSLPWAVGPDSGSMTEPVDQVETQRGTETSQTPESIVLYTVQAGDHLWSIAEHEVTLRAVAGVTDTEIATYWSRLIEANRDRLVDPDNTDLILPDQVLVLPF